eukprot:SAG31_NODE_62_length_28678_cov_21.548270_5_plen_265_part_00
MGTNCAEDVDECAADPCLNGGKCMESSSNHRSVVVEHDIVGISPGDYVCSCAPGFGGDHCAVDSAGYKADSRIQLSLGAPSTCAGKVRPGGWFDGHGAYVAIPSNSGRQVEIDTATFEVVNTLAIRMWFRAFSVTGADRRRAILSSYSSTATLLHHGATERTAAVGGDLPVYGFVLGLAERTGELQFELHQGPADKAEADGLSSIGKSDSWPSAHTFAWRPLPNRWYRVAVNYGLEDIGAVERIGGAAQAGFVDLFVDGRLVWH